MLHRMENARQKQLSWIDAILKETGWNQTELARRAGISHATLSKFRKDHENQPVLATETVSRIAAVSPIPHYENQRGSLPDGVVGQEASALDISSIRDPLVARLISSGKQGQNVIDAWVLHTRALENLGYLPGDIVLVDLSMSPREGDIVCAEFNDSVGNLETAFRVYHQPYLVAASGLAQYVRPILIDNRVKLQGVVVAALRSRMLKAS